MVVNGRIESVGANLPTNSATSEIDATGLLVCPGLIDLHTHVLPAATYWGIDPNPLASRTGVTLWVDAGSAGAYSVDALHRFVAATATVRLAAFLNISTAGLISPHSELVAREWCDVKAVVEAGRRHREFVRGIKVRVSRATYSHIWLDALRLAGEAAARLRLPLMVHIGDSPPPVEEVLKQLRPGDILTHAFNDKGMSIVDRSGRLIDAAACAWDAGVVFDVGHGSGSFSWRVAEALLAAGRPPDTISSDAHQLSVLGPMFDLPTCLSKFLHLGMTLNEVVRAATFAPSRVLRLERDLGGLRPGQFADVALFELIEGRFPLYDSHGRLSIVERLLVCRAMLIGGRRLRRLRTSPPAAWIRPTPLQVKLHRQGLNPSVWAKRARVGQKVADDS